MIKAKDIKLNKVCRIAFALAAVFAITLVSLLVVLAVRLGGAAQAGFAEELVSVFSGSLIFTSVMAVISAAVGIASAVLAKKNNQKMNESREKLSSYESDYELSSFGNGVGEKIKKLISRRNLVDILTCQLISLGVVAIIDYFIFFFNFNFKNASFALNEIIGFVLPVALISVVVCMAGLSLSESISSEAVELIEKYLSKKGSLACKKSDLGRKIFKGFSSAMVYAALILFALWVLLPFSLVLLTSFKGIVEANSLDFHWLPKEFTTQGYDKVLEYDMGTAYEGVPLIISGFINTLWIVIPPTLIGLFSSAISAYAFAKLRFKLRDKMFSLLLATMMIPGTILLTPTFIIYNNIGWVNTPLPLMIPGMFGAATCVFFMKQFYAGIPTELIEAAEIDGMSYFGIFFKVMIPLSVPALLAQALLGFIGGYNDYLGPLIYLQDPEMYTLQIAMNQLKSYFAGRNVPAMMAATIISIIPTIVLYIIAQKRFVEGVATSGMKV